LWDRAKRGDVSEEEEEEEEEEVVMNGIERWPKRAIGDVRDKWDDAERRSYSMYLDKFDGRD
jgi:hypothetical protein